jgi:predicted aconitase with swiveling domain
MIVTCALLAEAFFTVSIPVIDALEGNPLEALRTGDRVRIDGAAGLIEILPRG